jgi:3-hydroxyacyl-CoA dehydrogenase
MGQVFAELDRSTPHAILATNTSVPPVTAIAQRAGRRDRVVGTHWWNPPDREAVAARLASHVRAQLEGTDHD